ncbi:hypothetical protein J5I95_12335 [Candidatus Poribacteria bacterium]|nr:hypothetical protein [Candidatus Poribacteria bacterium]
MKCKNVVPMVALLIVLSLFPLFGLQAEPIVLGKAITWVHVGDKWDPSQMALVRAEFDEEISYGSKEYIGPQTAQAVMRTFDKPYDRKHSRTVVTVFPKASLAEIKGNEMMGIHAWSELLSKEGVPISFKEREIDARYPRTAWLQLLLERGITIESLIDYFLCMAHRHQLAFLEDSPHLWKTETHVPSAIDAWEIYKADYIERFVRYYARNWKTPAEATGKRIAAARSRIPKVPNVPTIPQFHSEPEETTSSPLQRLVNQLEQTVKDLERQNRWDAAEQVKEVLEHIKKTLARDKTSKPPSNAPNRDNKKKSRYPPL